MLVVLPALLPALVPALLPPPPPEKEHGKRNEHYDGNGADDDAANGTASEGFR